MIAILSISLILGILGMFSATAQETEPFVSIEKFNLTFESNVYIKYAVKLSGVEDANINDLKVLIWDTPQASYVQGSEDAVLSALGIQTIDGESYYIFAYTELAAKQMTEDIYAQACYEVDGKTYYSDVEKYSILQYAYNKLGITGTASTDEDFKTMLREMLQYGAAAQKHFGYNTDRLADADFYQITVSNAALSDGSDSGLYTSGSTVTMTAPEANADGFAFTGWQNASGAIISTDRSLSVSVGTNSTTYTACYGAAVLPTPEEYLNFTLLENDTYSISVNDPDKLPAELVLPSTYNGKAVTQIPDEGFRDCTNIITLIIPDSIEYIGNAAFAGCSNMITVQLPFIGSSVNTADDMHFGYLFSSSSNTESYKYVPSSLRTVELTGGERIGDQAFYQCSMLTSIIIPDSVKVIGNAAFYYCAGLTDIVLPDGVTSIGSYAFYDCTSLTSINIPDGITEIADYAFHGCKLASILLPSGLKSIGNYAFYGCYNFTSIEIPEGVESIGNNAFDSCRGLDGIDIPDSVITIGNSAFAFCDGMTSITIGNGVESIGDSAFYFCLNVTSLDIPDNVRTIGRGAFEDCRALVHITIGSGVTSIGPGRVSVGGAAFTGCSGIIRIENGVYYVDKWAVDCDTSVTEVVLRADTVGIADEAFSGCASLVSIEIPETVTNIGVGAFNGCYKLTDITLPESITVISDSVFCNCTSLASINIPDGVTYIGNSAFYDCYELTSIDIPDGVTYIGDNAFYSCQKLTFIVIPDGVEKIGTYMFRGCTALTSIVIGRGVNYIEYYAFSYSGLTIVYYMGTPEEWEAIDMPWQPVSDDNVFYYSENPPAISVYDYWNYVNGEIVVYYPEHPDSVKVS